MSGGKAFHGGKAEQSTPFIRSALFFDFAKRRMLVSYRRFGTNIRHNLQGPSGPRRMPATLRYDGQYLSVAGILLGQITPTSIRFNPDSKNPVFSPKREKH